MPRRKTSFSDLIDFEPPRWPTRGDRLFAPAKHWSADAEIHSRADTRAVFQMEGYKVAADRLVDEAADSYDRNGLVYPIVFCYRQFIELWLKWHIETYGHLCGAELPKRDEHNLKKLLRLFRKINHACGVGDVQAIVSVTRSILEFHEMDQKSFTFRYPKDRKTGVPYPVISDKIDLERLRDVMNGIESYFNGCDGYFDSIVSAIPYSEFEG